MTVDSGPVVSAITGVVAAVLSVGIAVTLLLVSVKVWVWLRSALLGDSGGYSSDGFDQDEPIDYWADYTEADDENDRAAAAMSEHHTDFDPAREADKLGGELERDADGKYW